MAVTTAQKILAGGILAALALLAAALLWAMRSVWRSPASRISSPPIT